MYAASQTSFADFPRLWCALAETVIDLARSRAREGGTPMERQFDIKGCALSRSAMSKHLAAMHFHDLAYDRQAETRTVFAAGRLARQFRVRLEKVREFLRSDSGSGIAH
jgi:hypothetical protein